LEIGREQNWIEMKNAVTLLFAANGNMTMDATRGINSNLQPGVYTWNGVDWTP
jgi:hypothetical protein